MGLQAADPTDDEAEPPGNENEDDDDIGSTGSLSVSDVRRARRDTGLSLEEVSKRSRIPVSMLRQLEWGYLRNWPHGLYGRTQLVRYARAAGLDRQLVLDAMLPLVSRTREVSPADDLTPAPQAPPVETTPAVEPPAIIVIDPAAAHEDLVDEDRPVEVGQPPIVATQAAVRAPEVPNPAERILAGRWEDPEPAYDPPLGTPSRPPSFLDSDAASDAPRRSSMLAAAAALVLVMGGAAWAVHSQWMTDDRASTKIVRRLPAREQQLVARATASAAPANEPLRPPALGHPSVLPISRPVSTSGAVPATDARLIPVDAIEDDTPASAAFASAGGVVFTDPVQPAVGTSDPTEGLGLRITRVVDDHSRNYHTRPSPDGTRVAFDSDRDGERAVFVANADGRNLRRISGEGFAAAPNWSPDGRTLSYVRAEVDNPNVWNLWAHNLDSGESRRLTSNPSGRPAGGSWFPDGHRIAYTSGSSLIVLDVASGKPAIYPSPQPSRKTGSPAVSPDGRWVIFPLSGDGAWLLDLNDGSSLKVLSDPAVGDFTWSPDGSRVAYYNRRENEWNVWVMAAR